MLDDELTTQNDTDDNEEQPIQLLAAGEENNVSEIADNKIVGTVIDIEGEFGSKVERKKLLTVVEWTEGSGASATNQREVIGARVEDSAVELNPDIETVTDILGVTYTDINKTEPQQDVEMPLLAGSKLGAYLSQAMFENNISAYNGKFTVYLIAAYIIPTSGTFYAVKHVNCSIIPTNLGGSSDVVSSVEIHFSNDLTTGSVATNQSGKLDKNFTFTAA